MKLKNYKIKKLSNISPKKIDLIFKNSFYKNFTLILSIFIFTDFLVNKKNLCGGKLNEK